VKVQLCPEDMLLEYSERLLQTHDGVSSWRQYKYLKHLPLQIELSEEFAESWQHLLTSVVRRFVADTFALRPFLFEIEGYTKRFDSTDEEFWNSCSFSFSHRSAERMYEVMMSEFMPERPLFLVALPGDALFLSICTRIFNSYSFQWLIRNGANWLIQALFIANQHVQINNVPWLHLLKNPAAVELPLREYLIERCADVVVACNIRMQSFGIMSVADGTPAGVPDHNERGFIEVSFYNLSTSQMIEVVRQFIVIAQAAINVWMGEGCVCIDDERFIRGAVQQSGFTRETNEFERLVKEYTEKRGMEETIYESIIQNQNSDRSSTE